MRKKTMRLAAPRFGELAYSQDDLYTFPSGLVGLPAIRHFLLIDLDEAGIFHCLQCVDDASYAFILVDPLLLKPDYKVKVDEGTIAILELEDLADAVAFATVSVPEDVTRMTANLRGPVLLNAKKRIGTQMVLPQSEYGVRVSITAALADQEQEEELHA